MLNQDLPDINPINHAFLASQRKQAVDRVFSQLIANLNYGIVVEDSESKTLLMNQLFCTMLGLPDCPAGMTGMVFLKAAELFMARLKQPEKFMARVDELTTGRQPATDDEIEMRDGRVLQRDYIPIYVDNEFTGNLWKFRDVTAERETQRALQRLSLVASANEDGVVFTDPTGVITWSNEGFARLTGYSPEEIIGNTPIALCSGPLTDKKSLKEMLRSFHAGDNFTVEVIHYKKDGSSFWGRVKGQSVLDEKKQIVQYFAMIEDITDQKKMELALIEAKEQAEESSKAKESFLTNMSHEIRTPMNAILGMCGQLKKTVLNDKQLFYLETVHTAAEDLLIVINDILDISKIEAGELGLEAIGFRMKDVLSRVIRVMGHKAEEKGIRLSWSQDGSIHPVLIGDPYRLNQVLLNLVSNAVKFTHRGSVLIECRANGPLNVGESQCIQIRVKDTGIGMSQLFIDRLFDKFSQEDISVTRKYGGTGLGMSISRQLVELMKGQIQVRSRKGEGTEMLLTIPFLRGEESDLKQEDKTIADFAIFEGKRILLAEDNEINRLIATTVLGNYGAAIDVAVNGLEALEMLHHTHYDLVLMDVQMPVMDGLEATRKIRMEMKLSIPVIAFTANAIKGEIAICLASGMNDYISKPFEEDKLIRTLTHWLGKGGRGQLYDLTRLKEIAKGNLEFVKKMVLLFLQEAPAGSQEMLAAYSNSNFELIKKTAHRLKSGLGTMGVLSLKEDMKEIESLAGNDLPCERLKALLHRAADIILRVSAGLEREYEHVLT
jgi:PAS domain S-box-containing protein